MALPDNYSFTSDHEWINAAADSAVGSTIKVGITEVATNALGEIVFVDLPQVGDEITAGESCGEVESTKSVSDIYAPVSGTVTAVNDALEDDPSIINSDAYEAGWLFEVEVTELGELLDAAAYEALDN